MSNKYLIVNIHLSIVMPCYTITKIPANSTLVIILTSHILTSNSIINYRVTDRAYDSGGTCSRVQNILVNISETTVLSHTYTNPFMIRAADDWFKKKTNPKHQNFQGFCPQCQLLWNVTITELIVEHLIPWWFLEQSKWNYHTLQNSHTV